MYQIMIYNVGKPGEIFKVFGNDGVRREASFACERDAMEATRIISMLRSDTAFEGSAIVT